MNRKTFRSHLLASSVFAGVALGVVAAPAVAQEETADEVQETIVVTGSRIAKVDFTSNSPVSTVGAEQFELTGTVNTESLLNTLPQTVPGLDRTSNNPGNGTATVNLRGLGSNRTLVLVDGKRMVGSGASGVVDLNNIPPALIDRVEVLTGGASAVYGADAIAGVVNFILKDDFEGMDFSAGYEVTQESDAQIYSTSLTLGGNFDDGRGNAVLSLSYADRSDLFQGDRDFASTALFDNGAGDGLEPGGSSGVPQTSIFAGFDFGVPVGADAEIGAGPNVALGLFNTDGTLRPFDLAGDENDFYNYAPVNYIQLPQERFTATGLARYEINEAAEVYSRFSFANNAVPQQLAPTPIFQTATFSLDNNPFIDAASQQIISDAIGLGVDTDADGIDDEARFLLRRRMLEVGPRRVESGFNAFQFVLGVEGEITPNLNYDVSFQEGRVQSSFSQAGNVSRSAFNQGLLLADADGDGNVDVDADGNPTCADGTGGCVPVNLYGQGNISAEAADFLRIRVNGDADIIQTVFSAYVTGDTAGAFELPGGPVGFSFGTEYREESFDFRPSQDLATGNIAGFNAQPVAGGSYDVYDIAGELYLPFLMDAPLAKELTAELAYRTSDYNTAGTAETYKISGRYAPIEDLAFRGSWNRAVRAPNIGELFGPPSEGFPGADDPCAADGGSVGDAGVRAICEATGVPAAAVFSAGINPASGQVRGLFGGNAALQPETADTFTIGAVYQPSYIEGLSVSLDYFDIEIEEVISSLSANAVLSTCYTDTANGGIGSPACSLVQRRDDGTIDFVTLTSQNAGVTKKAGFDLLAEYALDTDFGTFDFDYVGTFTTDDEINPVGADPIDFVGRFGTFGEPNPEYKHRFATRLSKGPFSGQLLWRYIGSVTDEPGFVVSEIDATSYFDLSGSWAVNDNLSITGGIDNLLDEEPPVIGDNDAQANTFPSTYDVFGRTFFINARVRF